MADCRHYWQERDWEPGVIRCLLCDALRPVGGKEVFPCNTDHAPLPAVIDPETGQCFRCIIRLIMEEMRDIEAERDALLYGRKT